MSNKTDARLVNREESSLPVSIAVIAIAIALCGCLIWAAKTRLPELVRAEGQIGTLNDLSRIDHFEGGVVRAIMVDPGSVVQRDQLLAIVAPPELESEIDAARQNMETLTRERQRLSTVLERIERRSGASSPETPFLASALGDSALETYIQSQDELYRVRLAALEQRIDRLRGADLAVAAMATNSRARLKIAEERLAKEEGLFEKGHISEAAISERRAEKRDLISEVLQAELDVLRAREETQAAVGAMTEAQTTWREELVARLFEVDGEIDALALRLEELNRRRAQGEIRAPQDGVVQNVYADAVGQVVAPGGPVLDMLASDDELVAIVRISPKDIGHLRVGAPVSIRPTTFDFRRYGDVAGSILGIAPTSQKEGEGQSFFRTVVALNSETIGVGAAQRSLRAGMEISADISTSDRSVLAYFLKPAERVLSVSLSER